MSASLAQRSTASGFYHCSVKNVGRAKGRSVVAAAAYRSGERLFDEVTGQTFDYRARGGVTDAFILTPANAPAWVHDRARLWNEAERAEARANGRLATELELALPHELDPARRKQLLKDFLEPFVTRHGLVADVAIHEPGEGRDHRNVHAHVLITHRSLDADGFGDIANARVMSRKRDGKEVEERVAGIAATPNDIKAIRKSWEQEINRAYERAGLDVRADHRSHAERGIEQEPTKHLGPTAAEMERRGVDSERGAANREITQRNAERQAVAALEAEERKLTAQIIDLQAERAKREQQTEPVAGPSAVNENDRAEAWKWSMQDLAERIEAMANDPKRQAQEEQRQAAFDAHLAHAGAVLRQAKEFSAETIELDQWSAVYLPIPELADAALLASARATVQDLVTAMDHYTEEGREELDTLGRGGPYDPFITFGRIDVGLGATRAEHREQAVERLAELDARLRPELAAIKEPANQNTPEPIAELDTQELKGSWRNAAAEAVHARESPSVTPEAATPATENLGAAHEDHSQIPDAGDIGDRIRSGITKLFGRFFDWLAPSPKPTPEVIKAEASAEAEESPQREAALSKVEWEARLAELLDEDARHRRQQEAGQEYDHDDGRGRDRGETRAEAEERSQQETALSKVEWEERFAGRLDDDARRRRRQREDGQEYDRDDDRGRERDPS
jgi:hypothetical protein